MKAIVLDRYGPPEVLTLRELPRPTPGPGEVLIRVRAAAVNPIDWRFRSGSLRWVMPLKLPRVLGLDVSGEVAELGPGVAEFPVGQPVYAYLDFRRDGSYAEFARADARIVAPKPASLSHEEAASLPLAGLTALQALRDLGLATAGAEVLVNGASGGVGSLAVQIGKAIGARVTAVCGPTNVELVRGLGADEVLDYRQVDFTRQERRYDVVFDAVAKSSYLACRRVLAPRGRYINTVPGPGTIFFHTLTRFGRQRAITFLADPSGDDLRYLAGLVAEGKLRPVIDRVLPLTEAAQAHALSQAGHARGKIVLRVA